MNNATKDALAAHSKAAFAWSEADTTVKKAQRAMSKAVNNSTDDGALAKAWADFQIALVHREIARSVLDAARTTRGIREPAMVRWLAARDTPAMTKDQLDDAAYALDVAKRKLES